MSWMTYPIKGWAPDLTPTAAGYLTDTEFVLPTDRGLSHAHYPVAYSAATGGVPMGGVVVQKIDGTERVFGGTASALYEFDISAQTYIDRSAATTYGASSLDTWDFSQFGDTTLAVNKQNKLQSISSGTDFADATVNAPKASIVVTVGPPSSPFAMLFDYVDASTNAYQDGWFSSAINDPAGWTPNIATQCVNGRLIDINGKFTAAIAWRDGVLAWKASCMYQGTYVGAPDVWSWRRVASDVGCIGKNAVCVAGDVAYWADAQGLWMFDGSYPQRIPGHVQNWWVSKILSLVSGSRQVTYFKDFVRAIYNKALGVVLFTLPGTAANTYLTSYAIAYNVRSQIWTQVSPYAGWGNYAATVAVHSILGPRNTYGLSVTGDGTTFFTWDGSFGALLHAPGTSTPSSKVSPAIIGEHGKIVNLRGVAMQRVPHYRDNVTNVTDAEFAAQTSCVVYHGPSIPLVNTTSAPYSASFTTNTSTSNNIGTIQGVATNKYVRPLITIKTSGFTADRYWEVDSIALDALLTGEQ